MTRTVVAITLPYPAQEQRVGSNLTASCFLGHLENDGEPRLILWQRFCVHGDSPAPPAPAEVEGLPALPPSGLRGGEGGGGAAGAQPAAAGRRAPKRRGRRGQAGRTGGGEKRGRGRRSRAREALEADALRPGGGRSPAPPHPAPPRSRPVPSPQRPAASRRRAPGTLPAPEALSSASSAAMAQHFSLAACDVVGFDLDHTLCRYNLPESALVSGAGCPGRTASTSMAAGAGLPSGLRAASAARGLRPPRPCAERGLPPRGRAEVCIPRALPARSALACCAQL